MSSGHRRVIVFDVETKVDEAFVGQPGFLDELKSSISAPENYKKPEAIEKYIEEEFAKRCSKFSLDPMTGRIVSIAAGWLDEDDVWVFASDDEADVLREFAEELPRRAAVLGGFNIRRFDVDFVATRAILHGTEFPGWWPHSKNYQLIADARDTLAKGSLQSWLKRFGLPLKTANGSDVEGMTIEQVAEYNANDVRSERALLRHMAGFVPSIRNAEVAPSMEETEVVGH